MRTVRGSALVCVFFTAVLLTACSSSSNVTDAGADDGHSTDADAAGDDGRPQADDGGMQDGGGDQVEPHGCLFPFQPPQEHILVDELGHEFQAWDQQVLCTLDWEDVHGQVFLIAEPTGTQFDDFLYEARDAWVCLDDQVEQLSEGAFYYEAHHHGWNEMEVAFDGHRYEYGWSETCIGYRPCTSSFDTLAVRRLSDGILLAEGLSATCVLTTMDGNPRPLTPQVRVPAEGDTVTFWMGSGAGDSDEEPVHEMTLRPFRLDVREATWADLALFLNDQGNDCNGHQCLDLDSGHVKLVNENETWRPEPGFAEHPAVHVTWYGAEAYCMWRQWMHPPHEAAWELAASAGGTRAYPWGDQEPDCNRALYDACAADSPQAVCSLPDGNSREGVCDLSGNVAEWVLDWYQADYYNTCASGCNEYGPQDPTGLKVVRGGSFSDNDALLRVADRDYDDPESSSGRLGVRCLRRTFPSN